MIEFYHIARNGSAAIGAKISTESNAVFRVIMGQDRFGGLKQNRGVKI